MEENTWGKWEMTPHLYLMTMDVVQSTAAIATGDTRRYREESVKINI